MGVYLFVRNNTLKKEVAEGTRENIEIKDFLPFGNGDGGIIDRVLDSVIPGRNDTENSDSTRKLAVLIRENVAGSITIDRADEVAGPTGVDSNGNNIYNLVPAIRYVLQENGYVYDYIPKYKKSYLISDTPIPKVSFADFSASGNEILFRYLDSDLITEKSVLGVLGVNNITILPDNISSFAFSGNGEFAYFKKTLTGSSLILISKDDTETILYNSPITEWNMEFMLNDILITTKASELAPGFSYIINKSDKKVTALWRNVVGLTTKSSANGNFILRSESTTAGPKLSLYNTKTGTLSPLGKLGLTEKCSFSNDATILICGVPKDFVNKLYPDAWYLGEIETDDGIIRYTTENLNERVLPNVSKEVGGVVDVWGIGINNAGNITTFINRANMGLWTYEE